MIKVPLMLLDKAHTTFKDFNARSMRLLKRLILGLGLIFLTLSLNLFCTDEDDIEDFQTFLEKNDGSEWMLKNDSLNVYIRINNNDEHLIEQWYFRSELKCYDYNPNIFVPGDCKIMENSADCLTVRGDYILSDFDSMTFSNEGNRLRVDIQMSEWRLETVYFTQSYSRIENLKECEPLDKMTCHFFKPCVKS